MKQNWHRIAATVVVAGLAALVGCTQEPAAPANQAPLAIFTPSVSNITAGGSVSFDASGAYDADGTIVSYSWEFGDFSTGSGETVSHTFATAGTFTVTLTVTDNAGATGSATTVISVAGLPTVPTGLTKVGSGCCHTYGTFSWNAVPGATAYEIRMDGRVGCLTDHSDTFPGSVTTGTVRAFGLCLGSQYDVQIRAQANGQWGAWSPALRITL